MKHNPLKSASAGICQVIAGRKLTSQLDTVLLLNITASVCLQILLESYFSITFLYFRPHFIVVLKLLLFFFCNDATREYQSERQRIRYQAQFQS